ncbi:TIGR03013 family XrtA/PEP-CTERM system glycosyltransferase [Aquabacterium sp.]|uniref:TIGR03013 family XrtA/PEP-CTERM system glycosyltransferase n=1 Tax=Aquabacterium sp. TaxID=1872578 RepID=UPI0035B065E4
MLQVFQQQAPVSPRTQMLADGLLCFFAIPLAAVSMHVLPLDAAIASLMRPDVVLGTFGFALFMSLLYSFVGMYRQGAITVSGGAMLGRAAMALLIGVSLTYVTVKSFADVDYARNLVAYVSFYLVLGWVIVRVSIYAAYQAGVEAPRVLIIGTGAEALGVAQDLKTKGPSQRSVVGFYPSSTNDHLSPNPLVFSSQLSIPEIVRRHNVNEVIVAVREQRGGGVPMDQLLDCRIRGIPVMDLAGFYERTKGEVPIDSLKASWLVYGHGFVQSAARQLSKRVFDVASSAVLLVLASPVMLITALAIKLESPGPVIYKQERVGRAGRTFMCLKFRSMRADAEKDGVARWATKNDSRITRVGAFIRKTRIDELPQLLSVLRGEMSMVGPRPERPSFVKQLQEQIPYYDVRHSIKPGVTGWAQVRYRYGSTLEDARKKHQYDLFYVKNNSLLLDFKILIETVSVVLFREGAQ